jgi:hypothetical protein
MSTMADPGFRKENIAPADEHSTPPPPVISTTESKNTSPIEVGTSSSLDSSLTPSDSSEIVNHVSNVSGFPSGTLMTTSAITLVWPSSPPHYWKKGLPQDSFTEAEVTLNVTSHSGHPRCARKDLPLHNLVTIKELNLCNS